MGEQMYNFGAIPTKEDRRDYRVSMFTPVETITDPEFKVTNVSGVYNQGAFGMCVAFAIAEIKEAMELKERGIRQRYSPAFIYGNRASGDYRGEGMDARQALDCLVNNGVCRWEMLNLISNYLNCSDWFKDPYSNSYKDLMEDARPQKVKSYVRASTVDEVKTILKINNYPSLIMIAVYPSFWGSIPGGVVPQVKSGETVSGYHMMIINGWTTINGKQHWIIQNSWGENFGVKGICYIPTDYTAIQELWGITDMNPTFIERTLLVAPKVEDGRFLMGYRDLFEALNGQVTWQRGADNKIKARAVIPPTNRLAIIDIEQDNPKIKISLS